MQASVEKMIRGYLGFLVGTGKAALTVSSYKGDLLVFKDFLKAEKLKFEELTQKDFEKYHYFLQKRGLARNTRRRKIITARSLYRYAFTRKKIEISPAKFSRPPERFERLPWIPNQQQFEVFLEASSGKTLIAARNKLIIKMLEETGLLVAELCALSWQDFKKTSAGGAIQVVGKKSRQLFISEELGSDLQKWKKIQKNGKYLFPGFNRHGLSTPKMTPRGVEMLFHSIGKKTNFTKLKPKTLRHFAVINWIKANVAQGEITRRLGVVDSYSLEPYKKFLEQVGK